MQRIGSASNEQKKKRKQKHGCASRIPSVSTPFYATCPADAEVNRRDIFGKLL